MHGVGTVASTLHCCNSSMKTPVLPLMYRSCSILFPKHIPVCAYVQILFENGNLMVIVMNVDLTDQKFRRMEMREILREGEVCLDARVSLGFTRKNDLGETWLFFPSAFPRTQGSRLLQEGRALPRHASLEGFLQATSRLFGCHWDCLKKICFCTILQGAPHQEKSRSPLSTWHCCYAFVNIKAKRLGQPV